MNKLLTFLKARRAAVEAETAALDDLIEDAEASFDPNELPTKFNPDWKDGSRLTTIGRRALEACFRKGMRQTEAARLFRISITRAHVLHREVVREASVGNGAERHGHV